MTHACRVSVLLLVAAGCASPLTVAEDRDAAPFVDADPQFNPGTPNDGSFDGEEAAPLGDPPSDAGPE